MAKKIALFDIDKTIYNGYIILSLAEYQLEKKIISINTFNNILEDANLYKKGLVDYETTIANLLIHWAQGLKDISYNEALRQTKYFLRNRGNRFFPFINPVIKLLKKTHDIYFVTGEPGFVAEAVTDLYRATDFFASNLEVENGIFTGKVNNFLSKREGKRKAIKEILKNYNIKGSIAFGDSEGDIEILDSVENAVCINPTEGLKKIAEEKGWIIVEPHKIEEIVKNILTEL